MLHQVLDAGAPDLAASAGDDDHGLSSPVRKRIAKQRMANNPVESFLCAISLFAPAASARRHEQPPSGPVPASSGESTDFLEQDRIGMLRMDQDLARRAGLDHAALLHDDDAVADVVGGGEVVGDVDDRDPADRRAAS